MGDETITHFIHNCPPLMGSSREWFGDSPPCGDMKWSVRSVLDFSFIPGVNEAYEGTAAHGDPMTDEMDSLNYSSILDSSAVSEDAEP